MNGNFLLYGRMSDLPERIREAAQEVGGLKKLAELIDAPRRTLGSWLQGRKPKPEALQDIASAAGISLNWLVSGTGHKHETDFGRAMRLLDENSGNRRLTAEEEEIEADAFEQAFGRAMQQVRKSDVGSTLVDPSKAPPQVLDPELLEQLARLARSVHEEFGITLPGDRATMEAAKLFNELTAKVLDLSDAELVEATLPQLRLSLTRRLKEAAAAPGTGKRSAS